MIHLNFNERVQTFSDFFRQTADVVRSFFSRARAFDVSTVIFISVLNTAAVYAAPQSSADASAAAQMIKSADLKTKYAGLEALKSNRSLETAQLLAKSAIGEKDAQFRLAVLDQLAALGFPAVVPTIAPVLRDRAVVVRQRAARVIGMLGTPAAEKALATALASESDADVKAAILQGLTLCGTPESVAAIQSAMRDSHPHVRANGVAALGQIPGDASKAALATAENDEDKSIRKLAQDARKKRSKIK